MAVVVGIISGRDVSIIKRNIRVVETSPIRVS